MRTLHIHIGYPKTGTTTIQNFLYKNKKLLEKYNFSLFTTDYYGVEQHTGRAAHWTPYGPGGRDAYEKTAKRLARALVKCPCDNVLISEEAFSTAFERATLEKFYAVLKEYFHKLQVHVYIRRQDRYTVSLLQEASKRPSPITGLYGHATRALPVKGSPYTPYFYEDIEVTDYYTCLSMWGDIFGIENMRVRVFEAAQLFNGSLVQDFLQGIGLEKRIPVAEEKYLGTSKGFEYTKVGHLILKAALGQHVGSIIRKHLDSSGKSLPSRKDAEDFYAQFREMNKKLNQKFMISSCNEYIFDDDFSDYPDESQDVWTEESANNAILNILQSIPNIIADTRTVVEEEYKEKMVNLIQMYKKALTKKNIK